MAKTKQQKQDAVKILSDKLKTAKSSVFFNYDGLTVNDSQVLRDKCKEQNVEILATKKTFLNRALEEQDLKDVDAKAMEGSLAVAFSNEDEVAPAKLIKEFSKAHEQVEFRGGILEGKAVSLETLKELADLPSKIELLAKVVGSIKAPISGFVTVLRGNLSGLVNVLNAIKDNK